MGWSGPIPSLMQGMRANPQVGSAAPAGARADDRRADRNFFLVMLAAAWLAIISGFANDVAHRFAAGTLSYPWIVHVHAALFVGWLVLFTVQLVLVRRGAVQTHRRLGIVGAVLATAMVPIGMATAVITEQVKFGSAASDPAFIAVMFGDMLVFGGLAAAGIGLRARRSAHRRLMLIATLALTDAGFGRGLSPLFAPLLGGNYWEMQALATGLWPFVGFQMLPADTLILTVGLFDFARRGRLEPAYVAGVVWCFGIQLGAGVVYFDPTWRAAAVRFIGT